MNIKELPSGQPCAIVGDDWIILQGRFGERASIHRKMLTREQAGLNGLIPDLVSEEDFRAARVLAGWDES